ncbi:hypothetical protein HN51_069256 [Arachis hypogaea]
MPIQLKNFLQFSSFRGHQNAHKKERTTRRNAKRASAEHSYLLFASSLWTPPTVFPSTFITAANLAYFPSRHISEGFGSNGEHEFAGDNGVFPYRLSEDIDERSFGDWQRSLGRSSSFNSVDT